MPAFPGLCLYDSPRVMSRSKARSFRQLQADQVAVDLPHELDEGEPVSAANCTVNGIRYKNNSPIWIGLDFVRAELRTQSTVMLYAVGQDKAPYDLHLSVPWMHPEVRPTLGADPDTWVRYRVKPRREKGARFYQRDDGQWMLAHD